MVKYIYPLFIFLSFTIQLFSQEASISTKFSQDGKLYQTEAKSSEAIAEFKENQKCVVTAFLGNYTYKIKYKDLVGFVKDQYLFVNEQMMDLYFDHEEKQREKAVEERKNRQGKVDAIAREAQEKIELIEQKRRDSIAAIKAKEIERLLQIKRNDSIVKAKEEQRIQRIAKAKKDSIAKVVKEQNRLLAEKQRNDSIATVREETRKQLEIQKRNDSIAKVKDAERKQQIEKRKTDSIVQLAKERNRILIEKRKKEAIEKAKKEAAAKTELEAQKELARQKRNAPIAKVEDEAKTLEKIRKKDSIAKIEADQKNALALLRKRNDSVVEIRNQEKALAETKRKDSIARIEEEEKKALAVLRKRNDSISKIISQEKALAQTKREDSIINAKAQEKLALEELRKRNTSIAKANIEKNNTVTGNQNADSNQVKIDQSKLSFEKKRYDSIVKVREQERKQLVKLRRQNDSISKIIEEERKALETLRKDNANVTAQVKNNSSIDSKAENQKRLEMLERLKFRDSCHYQINEFDKFYNITTIRTEAYALSNNLTVELYKQGKKLNVFFNYDGDLGCASYLPNQRSSVKVTLENNQTISFYHSWDIECNAFLFKGRLSSSQIEQLKNAPIKSILIKGTEDSTEINFIDYKEFFIDKLKCIE